MKAIWNGVTLADSDETVEVEGIQYFPPDSLNREYFVESDRRSVCPWKGMASYYDVTVNGEVNQAAAWYYAEPSAAAQQIKGHVAFWKGVQVDS